MEHNNELSNAQKKLELNMLLFKIMRNPENYEILSENDFVHDANGELVYDDNVPECAPLRKPDSFLRPIPSSYHNASEFLYRLPNNIAAPRLMPEMDGTMSITWDHVSKDSDKAAAIIRFIGDDGFSGFIEFGGSQWFFNHVPLKELNNKHLVFEKLKEFVEYHTIN